MLEKIATTEFSKARDFALNHFISEWTQSLVVLKENECVHGIYYFNLDEETLACFAGPDHILTFKMVDVSCFLRLFNRSFVAKPFVSTEKMEGGSGDLNGTAFENEEQEVYLWVGNNFDLSSIKLKCVHCKQVFEVPLFSRNDFLFGDLKIPCFNFLLEDHQTHPSCWRKNEKQHKKQDQS